MIERGPAWDGYMKDLELAARRRRLEDLEMFRTYVRRGVRLASPILVDAARAGLLDLPDALRRMRPDPTLVYNRRIAWRAPSWFAKTYASSGLPHHKDRFAHRHRWMGAAVRGADHRQGRLGISIAGGVLEIEIGLPPHRIMTHDGIAELDLRAELPESVLICLPGRPADLVVDHPLITGKGYTVVAAEGRMARTRVTVRTGLARIDLPDF